MNASVIRIALLFFFVLASCNQWENDYKVTKEYFYAKFKLSDGFKLSELKVISFSDDNIPKEFEKTITCLVGLNSNFDKFDRKKVPSIPQNKIFFKKKNESYKWIKYKGNNALGQPHEVYEVMPIELKKETWYFIEFSSDGDTIFFLIEKNGSVKTYVKRIPFSIV